MGDVVGQGAESEGPTPFGRMALTGLCRAAGHSRTRSGDLAHGPQHLPCATGCHRSTQQLCQRGEGSDTYSADWETEAPGHTASVQEPKCHPRLSRIFAPSLSSERKTATSWGRGSRGGPAAARFFGLVGGPPPLLSSRRAAVRVSALSSIRLSPEVLCLGGFGGREPRGEGSSSRWQVSEMFRCAVDAFGHFWKILNYDLFEYLFFFSLSLPSPSAIPTASSHPGRELDQET